MQREREEQPLFPMSGPSDGFLCGLEADDGGDEDPNLQRYDGDEDLIFDEEARICRRLQQESKRRRGRLGASSSSSSSSAGAAAPAPLPRGGALLGATLALEFEDGWYEGVVGATEPGDRYKLYWYGKTAQEAENDATWEQALVEAETRLVFAGTGGSMAEAAVLDGAELQRLLRKGRRRKRPKFAASGAGSGGGGGGECLLFSMCFEYIDERESVFALMTLPKLAGWRAGSRRTRRWVDEWLETRGGVTAVDVRAGIHVPVLRHLLQVAAEGATVGLSAGVCVLLLVLVLVLLVLLLLVLLLVLLPVLLLTPLRRYQVRPELAAGAAHGGRDAGADAAARRGGGAGAEAGGETAAADECAGRGRGSGGGGGCARRSELPAVLARSRLA